MRSQIIYWLYLPICYNKSIANRVVQLIFLNSYAAGRLLSQIENTDLRATFQVDVPIETMNVFPENAFFAALLFSFVMSFYATSFYSRVFTCSLVLVPLCSRNRLDARAHSNPILIFNDCSASPARRLFTTYSRASSTRSVNNSSRFATIAAFPRFPAGEKKGDRCGSTAFNHLYSGRISTWRRRLFLRAVAKQGQTFAS